MPAALRSRSASPRPLCTTAAELRLPPAPAPSAHAALCAHFLGSEARSRPQGGGIACRFHRPPPSSADRLSSFSPPIRLRCSPSPTRRCKNCGVATKTRAKIEETLLFFVKMSQLADRSANAPMRADEQTDRRHSFLPCTHELSFSLCRHSLHCSRRARR